MVCVLSYIWRVLDMQKVAGAFQTEAGVIVSIAIEKLLSDVAVDKETVASATARRTPSERSRSSTPTSAYSTGRTASWSSVLVTTFTTRMCRWRS